ncbi:sulfite exporter TauE/SafE family protein [Sphingomonas canadensis]|uniref:Probable membrane transporter protein n=1 Tax=Sphingomonas canadensis TaxID=1219257 RepID=A0ABW3H3F4_9SPHN|nr:sulfite exporter TauE/SafE family protein [Sphingomonas canadensis]MCW3835241.1 sulfite exporter TauE/SafE family protein [Sphingomonas canadensis]
MADPGTMLLAGGAGMLGGAMNALAGGGTFATLPALIAMGLPANIANASSNVALLPGAAASAWTFRDELAPVAGVPVRTLAAITFAGGLIGSALLLATPSDAFDMIIPWLLLYAFAVLAFGQRASEWLRARVTIGPRALVPVLGALGVYGGYFGGGVGLMTTATLGLLAGVTPRSMFAPRTLMLAVSNAAAAILFVGAGMVHWAAAVPMLAGAMLGGWIGALAGRAMPHALVRWWTLLVTGATTLVFFARAYGLAA